MASERPIIVVGSGLAGSQAALTIARLGGRVTLVEMRPQFTTPAHQTADAAELVCSNSLRSNDPHSAAGLLKEELRRLDCELMRFADEAAIPGGTSLTVDRAAFSKRVTQAIAANPLIDRRGERVGHVPTDAVCILATGPLTSDALAASIQSLTGQQNLFFYDAIAPVVDADTVDMSSVFAASRYDKSGGDFVNCPMDRARYAAFREALLSAQGFFKHAFEEDKFHGCPPLEQIARAGEDTLRFGPLKPVGLRDPRTGQVPHAVLQLRRENLRSDSYNLVACQNQLKFGEQERVFRMVPGLERAEFIRFGQMHRNTYVRAPALLDGELSLRARPDVFFAGQLAGVEGYIEAMATGFVAGVNAFARATGGEMMRLPRASAVGSLCHYLVHADADEFTPVRFTLDLLPPIDIRDRTTRRRMLCERALAEIDGTKLRLRPSTHQQPVGAHD